MNFLKKLFNNSKTDSVNQEKKNPENTRLIYLMDIYQQHRSSDNYKAVMNEILHGNAFLLLPTANPGLEHKECITLDSGTLDLWLFNVDGLKVIGAFTNEFALTQWSKAVTQYTTMNSHDVIKICQQNVIDRIVINSGQKNMFVIERDRRHIQRTTVEEDTKVQIGTPTVPLKQYIVDRLVENFKNVDTIEEAYQFAQNMNGEKSIVLGIKLSVNSDNSRAALLNAMTNSIGNEKTDLPVSIMILETEDWLIAVGKIQNALFYKKQ
jgi:hypothetical protein